MGGSRFGNRNFTDNLLPLGIVVTPFLKNQNLARYCLIINFSPFEIIKFSPLAYQK
nr:MAG TPA: hypothetical protein [Caudoviricetes sp.]